MPLRCFLFSSDEGTVAMLRQILSGLGVEGEFFSNAVTAAEKITSENFQIVIIDWDQQPEAGILLNTARERKAAERPLTLAIVSDDASAPHALHAGANSLLRKPIAANQARDTLITARDLIHAKQGTQGLAAQAAAAGAGPAQRTASPSPEAANVNQLRPPQLIQTLESRASTLFEAEVKTPRPVESPNPAPAPVELKVDAKQEKEEQSENRDSDETVPSENEARGLRWYMKTRVADQASAPVPSRGNPDLIGYQQTRSYAPKPAPAPEVPINRSAPAKFDFPKFEKPVSEPPLFSSIQGAREQSGKESAPVSEFKKRAIVAALILAGIAMFMAPQAPWHPTLQATWRNGRHAIHGWLYPQPVTPAPAPAAHESFTRAGDEYKLPVPEAIPDATTDPSQIQVLPAVDPTAKKPNDGSAPDQPVGLPEAATNLDAPAQSPGTHVPENQSPQPAPVVMQPITPSPALTHPTVTATTPAAVPHNESTVVAAASVPNPAPSRPVQVRAPSTPANVPQSLKSQLTSMTPESSGNKAPETALPTIEPVIVPEAQERALLIDQPAPAYPVSAKGQQGTVTLQVLIGRDGTVQDAKFLQGSLVFARGAIDAVKQWKFKPYIMNTRPVSVQTVLTLKFKPGQ
jgi:periplasmic protein TonB